MLKIYNNKTKKKEIFKPLKENEVSLYVCGPTLYDKIHIGNARPIVFFDVVYRFFKKQNYNIKYVSNITDIDDKIINKALEIKKTEKDVVDDNLIYFKKDLEFLNIKEIDLRPKVTDHIDSIINFIEELLIKDFAYKANNGDIYFKIKKIDDYGKISNRNIEDLIVGSRIEIDNYKKDALDFVLWKNTKEGIVWDAPFGPGRPGWHTECVVLINELLGEKIDIHGGGVDLKFPHHENENAQNCAMNNHDIANYWVHNGFVNINNEKMSKSLNNFITVDDMKKYPTNVIRLLLLQTNYAQPINLNDEFIEQTIKLNNKIDNFSNEISKSLYEESLNNDLSKEIIDILEDDFNTPNLISYLLKCIKDKNYNDFILITDLLGLIINLPINKNDLNDDVLLIVNKIEEGLKNKDFDIVDNCKKDLDKLGYEFIRTRSGSIIKKVGI